MKKISAKMVPEQKERYKDTCADMLQEVNANPIFFKKSSLVIISSMILRQNDSQTGKYHHRQEQKKLVKASPNSKLCSLILLFKRHNFERMGSRNTTVYQHY